MNELSSEVNNLRAWLLESRWFGDGWALRQVLRTQSPYLPDSDFSWVLPKGLLDMPEEPTSLMGMPVIWATEDTKPHLAFKLKEGP